MDHILVIFNIARVFGTDMKDGYHASAKKTPLTSYSRWCINLDRVYIPSRALTKTLHSLGLVSINGSNFYTRYCQRKSHDSLSGIEVLNVNHIVYYNR